MLHNFFCKKLLIKYRMVGIRNRIWNRNFSQVGTGTAKIRYQGTVPQQCLAGEYRTSGTWRGSTEVVPASENRSTTWRGSTGTVHARKYSSATCNRVQEVYLTRECRSFTWTWSTGMLHELCGTWRGSTCRALCSGWESRWRTSVSLHAACTQPGTATLSDSYQYKTH
jgi:hypothetical protein